MSARREYAAFVVGNFDSWTGSTVVDVDAIMPAYYALLDRLRNSSDFKARIIGNLDGMARAQQRNKEDAEQRAAREAASASVAGDANANSVPTGQPTTGTASSDDGSVSLADDEEYERPWAEADNNDLSADVLRDNLPNEKTLRYIASSTRGIPDFAPSTHHQHWSSAASRSTSLTVQQLLHWRNTAEAAAVHSASRGAGGSSCSGVGGSSGLASSDATIPERIVLVKPSD